MSNDEKKLLARAYAYILSDDWGTPKAERKEHTTVPEAVNENQAPQNA